MRRMWRRVVLIAGAGLIGACSSGSVDVPEALDGACSVERGCQFTEEVVAALCEELGQPERVELNTHDDEIRSIRVFETYPTVPPSLDYPVAVPKGTSWQWAIDCTVR